MKTSKVLGSIAALVVVGVIVTLTTNLIVERIETGKCDCQKQKR